MIEIKELVIRAVVDVNSAKSEPNQAAQVSEQKEQIDYLESIVKQLNTREER